MTDWEPGDALHDRETSVYLARQMVQLLTPFPDGMIVHPMVWTADGGTGPVVVAPTRRPGRGDGGMTGLAVGDTVNMDDAFGNHWVDGLITAVRPEGFYVRWPDAVIGVFQHKHAHNLKKADAS